MLNNAQLYYRPNISAPCFNYGFPFTIVVNSTIWYSISYIVNKYYCKNKGIDDQKYLNNHLQAVMAVICTSRGLMDVGELFVKKKPKLKIEKSSQCYNDSSDSISYGSEAAVDCRHS
jgi:hypothetical protein